MSKQKKQQEEVTETPEAQVQTLDEVAQLGAGTRALAVASEIDYSAIEALLAKGDLSQLQPDERAKYILTLCRTLQLNPMTKPFDFLTLNGRLILYINRNATDQLRKVHRVNLTIVERGVMEVGGQPTDVYTVKAHAALPDGRTDESVGAVSIRGKSGEDLANCVMRAETKAKRRVTLSILGLSFTDESELDTINYVKPQSNEPRQFAPRQPWQPQPSVVDSSAISPGVSGVTPSGEATSSEPAAAPSAGLPPPTPFAGRGPQPMQPTSVGGPLPPPRPATPAPQVGQQRTSPPPAVVVNPMAPRPRPGQPKG